MITNLIYIEMKDLIERLTSWKTTIVGAATLIIAVLVFFKVVQPENQGEAVAGISNFWDGIVQVMASVSGLILIFSKDSDKKA